MEKSRRHYSPEQKVAILREHLIEQVPVSQLCEKHQIHPTLFYQWQKTFFENGAAAFERERPRSQSNGKIERWHQTLKADCLRLGCPLSLQEAQRLVERFVAHYNNVRLHSAIGYITPADRLAARHLEIFAARDKKLDAARQNRKLKCQQLTQQQLP